MKSLYCSFKFIKRKYNFLVQQYVQLYFSHSKLIQVYSHYKNLAFYNLCSTHLKQVLGFLQKKQIMSLYHYCVLQSLIIIEYSSMSRGANSFIKLNQVFFFRYQFRLHIDRCVNLQSVYLSAFNTRFLNRPSTVKPGFVRILSICKHRQASIVSFSTLRISINTFVFHKITRLVGPSTPTETDLMNVQILLVPARL